MSKVVYGTTKHFFRKGQKNVRNSDNRSDANKVRYENIYNDKAKHSLN